MKNSLDTRLVKRHFLIAVFAALLWTTAVDSLPGADAPQGPVEPHGAMRIRRDPFLPQRKDPISNNTTRRKRRPVPLEQYDLEELQVVGIVWQIHPPKAMLEDNRGMGYVVGPGTRIGRKAGRVKQILPDRIVVERSYSDKSGTRVRERITMMLSRWSQR